MAKQEHSERIICSYRPLGQRKRRHSNTKGAASIVELSKWSTLLALGNVIWDQVIDLHICSRNHVGNENLEKVKVHYQLRSCS